MTNRPDLIGAPCTGCNRRWKNWGACHTCAERPFGSAPCPSEGDYCPCENEMICRQIAAREWPLAEVAIDMYWQDLVDTGEFLSLEEAERELRGMKG
jgi:hypothetical protein